MNVIDEFSGVYGFLSNFHPADVYLDGVRYPTVEHAFQAAKVIQIGFIADYRASVLAAQTAGQAKRFGQTAKLRPDWELVKISVMENLLRQKFERGTVLHRRLLNTHPAQLVEGNWWHDMFWGMYRGKGRNELGKLLMKIRDE